MVETKHYDLQAVFDAAGGSGVFSKHATQLMALHRRVSQVDAPVVLECGVDVGLVNRRTGSRGRSQGAGRLISLDIVDCSDAIISDSWTFLQIDDSDQERVLQAAPILKDGIDLVLIDSWHAVRHVRRVLGLWYPLVRQGGWIAFHDVDPGPYMRGQRRDNIDNEIVWRDKAQFIMDFFYANEDDLLLQIIYGDMGMAIMQKLAPMSKPPQPARHIPHRRVSWRSVARRLSGRAR